MLSTDNFYFNSKPYNIPFYLSIENFPFSHITIGGKIDFNLWDRFQTHKKFQNLTFIKSLKNLGLISGYEFSFIYDSNNLTEDTGNLYVGASLHNIDSNKCNASFFNSTYVDSSNIGQWNSLFKKLFMVMMNLKEQKMPIFILKLAS